MFKSVHNFKIKRLNGELIDLYEAGIGVLGLEVPSPNNTRYAEAIEGRDGYIDLGETLEGRILKGRFYIEALDHIDQSLVIDKVYRIFDSREPFYIIRDLQPNKEILVRKSGGFSPSQEPGLIGEFAIDFSSGSPYWRSIGNTLDPITFEGGKWGIGMGLQAGIEYKYTFNNETVFSIYNPGQAVIDPRDINQELVIEYTGPSTALKITNDTTGEVWQYLNGSSLVGDVIKLDGVKAFKNSSSIFKDTNRGLISLKPGKNDILITGNTGDFEIKFITRFYYL